MGDLKIKVTDRRLFTEEGELREDYDSDADGGSGSSEDDPDRDSFEAPIPSADCPSPTLESPEPSLPEARAPQGQPSQQRSAREPASPSRRPPSEAPAQELPARVGMIDLVASLAEPIALFLGDAQLPDGQSSEDLDRARFYIDLLRVLSEKTAGNLTADEDAVLSDLVYQLQMRYVQKRG